MMDARKYLEETQSLSMGFPLPKDITLKMDALIWLLEDYLKEAKKKEMK